MAPRNANLDLGALRTQLSSLLEADRDQEVLDVVVQLVSKLSAENRALADRLATFMRGRAHGGSERISASQLLMFMSQVDGPPEAAAEGTAEAELEDEPEIAQLPIDVSETEQSKPPRKRLRVVGPVERSTERSEPPEDDRICPDCGTPKSPAGGKKRLLVEVIPAQFRIIEHIRVQYGCRCCDDPHLVIGPPANTPLESGALSNGLLTDFLCRKHLDHEPVNHIAETYTRMGIEFPLGTLYGWVGVGADLLQPLAKRIISNALAAAVFSVDDTGVTVLDDDLEKGSRRGHLWILLGDDRWAGFQFTPDWKAERAEKFLGVREGWMQADAYAGFDRLYARGGVIEVGCWAHGPRYFVKALDVGDARAATALDLIGRLFKVERRADEKGYDNERRLRLRLEKSRPILNDLGRWVDSVHAAAPPDTPLGRAITYLTNQWRALCRFLEDGRLRLTNNDAERQLRHIALGRNAWLFTGSDAGGERLAILYTCIATCKLAGVDPRASMLDVLNKLTAGWPASRLDELLPPVWAAAQKALEQSNADQVA